VVRVNAVSDAFCLVGHGRRLNKPCVLCAAHALGAFALTPSLCRHLPLACCFGYFGVACAGIFPCVRGTHTASHHQLRWTWWGVSMNGQHATVFPYCAPTCRCHPGSPTSLLPIYIACCLYSLRVSCGAAHAPLYCYPSLPLPLLRVVLFAAACGKDGRERRRRVLTLWFGGRNSVVRSNLGVCCLLPTAHSGDSRLQRRLRCCCCLLFRCARGFFAW